MKGSDTLNSTDGSVPDTAYVEFYNIAKEVTGLYLFPIICLVGIMGNVLTFVVFINFKPRSSTNVYLTTLSISDTIKLLCDFLYFIVVVLDKMNYRHQSLATYNTLYPYAHYVLNFALCNTAWLTVSVAVERFIYMKWPERAQVLCSIRRAKITCCVVWICAMVITIPFGMRYQQITANGTTNISVTPLWQIDQFKSGYVWFQNIVRSVIPVLVLVIINAWIIRSLSRNAREFHARPLACRNRVTIMLVAVIVAFVICITPDAIMSAVFGFGYTEAPYLVRGIREITDVLLSLNSAINFFLYSGFNRVFRHNFARVFLKKYYWKRLALKDNGVT